MTPEEIVRETIERVLAAKITVGEAVTIIADNQKQYAREMCDLQIGVCHGNALNAAIGFEELRVAQSDYPKELQTETK